MIASSKILYGLKALRSTLNDSGSRRITQSSSLDCYILSSINLYYKVKLRNLNCNSNLNSNKATILMESEEATLTYISTAQGDINLRLPLTAGRVISNYLDSRSSL